MVAVVEAFCTLYISDISLTVAFRSGAGTPIKNLRAEVQNTPTVQTYPDSWIH